MLGRRVREVVAAGNLRRSASVQTGGDGSARRGFLGARAGRSGRLGNSGRWPNMSMLARTCSARLPAGGSVRRGEADAPAKGAKVAGDGKAVEQCDGGACPHGVAVTSFFGGKSEWVTGCSFGSLQSWSRSRTSVSIRC
ncbi:E3 ubiquitin-protein ligase ATL6-like [Panicum miliaceum]|uniref:E3 ubiquitin-protein ligase ATL6-like n=1 Tax=Panicum miliaceum TaxID=4540 RepID=A0A3L6SBR3_PANMI|nr:E3 ubiquitin-protein ligase ATL6-like [Panicum miliaceum]